MNLSSPLRNLLAAAILLPGSAQAQNINCCSDGECGTGNSCIGACCICVPPQLGVCLEDGSINPPSSDETITGCFSADSTVQVWSKGTVAMKDLAIGDYVVSTGLANHYERVYAFGHRNPKQTAEFVRIITSSSTATELTSQHLVNVQGRFVKASSVHVGDILQSDNDLPTEVTKVETIVRKDGVYAPLTVSGTILVDGVVASSYIAMQAKGNEHPVFSNGMRLPVSWQQLDHIGLSPFRMLCMGVSSSFCNIQNQAGVLFWVDGGLRLAAFVDHLPTFIQAMIFVLLSILVLPLYAVEYLVGARMAPLAMLTTFLVLAWSRKAVVKASLSAPKKEQA